MDALRHALGVLFILDLAAGVLLLLAAGLLKRRTGVRERGMFLAFGCLTACLLVIYAALWMIAGGRG